MRSQRLAIPEYARQHDFRIDDFIEATASGQASEKRRRLDELMNVLQRGFAPLASISRSGPPGRQRTLAPRAGRWVRSSPSSTPSPKAGIAFVALKENIRVKGKRDIQTKVMTTLFALFAEVERDLISIAINANSGRSRDRRTTTNAPTNGCPVPAPAPILRSCLRAPDSRHHARRVAVVDRPCRLRENRDHQRNATRRPLRHRAVTHRLRLIRRYQLDVYALLRFERPSCVQVPREVPSKRNSQACIYA